MLGHMYARLLLSNLWLTYRPFIVSIEEKADKGGRKRIPKAYNMHFRFVLGGDDTIGHFISRRQEEVIRETSHVRDCTCKRKLIHESHQFTSVLVSVLSTGSTLKIWVMEEDGEPDRCRKRPSNIHDRDTYSKNMVRRFLVIQEVSTSKRYRPNNVT